jgi:1,4-dihydroxy-2-naphthoyl-CoA hydrolase
LVRGRRKALSDERDPVEAAVALNEFFGPRVPGLLGVTFDSCAPDEVVGHIDVTDALIAGTGFLFAPAIVALADTLAAGGTGANLEHPGESFTTIELKANFLGSASVGQAVVGTAVPVHRGKSTHVWDVTVVNASSDRVIALFRCTQMILRG